MKQNNLSQYKEYFKEELKYYKEYELLAAKFPKKIIEEGLEEYRREKKEIKDISKDRKIREFLLFYVYTSALFCILGDSVPSLEIDIKDTAIAGVIGGVLGLVIKGLAPLKK